VRQYIGAACAVEARVIDREVLLVATVELVESGGRNTFVL
jgi:hypothetical protein